MPVEVLQDNKKKTAKLLEAFTTIPSFNFGGIIDFKFTYIDKPQYNNKNKNHLIYESGLL